MNIIYKVGDENDAAEKVLQRPISLDMTGYYAYGSGKVSNDTAEYWTNTVYNGKDAYFLELMNGYVTYSSTYSRGDGYALRCVAR